MTTPPDKSTPRSAASIVLIRDGARGIEVYVIERHRIEGMAFSGHLVFPGGKVDAEDDRWPGLTAPAATPPLGFWVAAVRETFEEAGILLARPAGHPATTLAGGTAARRLVERARARPQGEIAFADLLAAEGLSPALDTLVHFGHWITPAWAPRRFDTHFFLVAAPDGQSVDLDVGESASALWTRPADMLAEIEAGKRTLVAVTRFTLELLATYGGVAEAIAAARQRPVVTVQPIRETGPDGTLMLRIPRHAGYPRWEMPAKGA